MDKIKEDNPAKLVKDKGLYEYINKLQPPDQPSPHMPYRFMVQQAAIFPPGEDRYEKIFNRLVKYGMVKEKSDSVMHKIRLAANWADDNRAETKSLRCSSPGLRERQCRI